MQPTVHPVVLRNEIKKLARSMVDELLVKLQADKLKLEQVTALRNDIERMTRAAMAVGDDGERLAIIAEETGRPFGIGVAQIIGRNRHEQYTVPRNIAYYLTRRLLDISYERIGDMMDNRDHGTIMNGERRVRDRMDLSVKFKTKVEKIEAACSKRLAELEAVA